MAIQDLIFRNGFTQRFHRDGTVDSICLFCFATVRSSGSAEHLSQAEALHNCWQGEEAKSPERTGASRLT